MIVMLLATACACAGAKCEDYDVHIRVDSESGTAVGVTRDWYRMLTELGVARLSIAEDRKDPEPDLRAVESGIRPRIEVQAILSPRGVLVVPERSFRLGDRAKVKTWLTSLKDGSALATNKTSGPFNLTPAENQRLSDELAPTAEFFDCRYVG